MRRILIVRLSAIGDVVMAAPVAQRLRDHYPGAHIAWLAQEAEAGLLGLHPALDEVIVWPRGRWRELRREGRRRTWLRELRALAATLRSRRFDVAIDLQGLLKSAFWARLSGAPRRIGLGPREGSRLLVTRHVPRPPGDPGYGSEYRSLLDRLGVPPEPYRVEWALGPELKAGVAERIRENGVGGDYAVLCPFTTRPQKHWVEERWLELGQELERRTGLRPLVLGGPGDRIAARGLQAGGLPGLVGETTLAEAAAAIAGARLLVGVDTGLTHLGLSLGTPTVALFGSTRPYLEPGVPHARVIYRGLPCSPCRRRPVCGGSFDCMAQIRVDEVCATAAGVLGAR